MIWFLYVEVKQYLIAIAMLHIDLRSCCKIGLQQYHDVTLMFCSSDY